MTKRGTLTVATIVAVAAIVALFFTLTEKDVSNLLAQDKQTEPAQQQHRAPILVSGVQEPDEMRVEPLPLNNIVPTAPERMLADAMKSAGNNQSPNALLPALNQILAQYPDFSDGYVMRLGGLCEGNDRIAILSDINNAIKYLATSRVGNESLPSLLSMKAKLEHANGDDSGAMDDLDKTIHADLAKAIEFANSGGTAPEKTASVCTWTEPDLDALVQRFPGDYRPYMFRALYHGFFLFFEGNDTTKRDSLNRAFDDLDAAVKLNPSSVLPHFFKAEIFYRTFGLKMMSIYDTRHDELNNTMITLLNFTLAYDHDNVWALSHRALMFSHLKKWQQAIDDYDKVIALEPKDYAALNDRAEAKIEIGDMYGAISDLGEVIRNQERQLQHSTSFEVRADAYMKTRQWDLAIRDLADAISLQVGGQVFLSDVNHFRALYPEYGTASDDAIARKLQQTFYPNMSYENFSDGFLHKNDSFGFPDFVVADLFLKRSDAHLNAGDWRAAKLDFQRAQHGYPSPDLIDRWREIDPTGNKENLIDMKTFDFSQSDAINVWIKQTQASGDTTGPYSLEQQFELNCAARQIRMMSFASYDASGQLMSSHGGGAWNSVAPETLSETLYDGVCRSN